MSAPAARGLPAPLPDGERVMWQGAPTWRGLARRAVHADKAAAYFAALSLLALVSPVIGGEPLGAGLQPAGLLLCGGLFVTALLALYAFMVKRTTTYTLTSGRLVLRLGIALPVTVDMPLGIIETASARVRADGTGDIALSLSAGQRTPFLLFWPHVRPWRLSRAEPMLRCVPDVASVARLLAGALAASSPEMAAARQPAPEKSRSRESRAAFPAGSAAAA